MPRHRKPSPPASRLRALSRLAAKNSTLPAERLRELLEHAESENAWRLRARKLARLLGFSLQYHTHNSHRSDHGWPDEVWARESDGRVLYFEFKRIDGSLTVEQYQWLDFLWSTGHEAACWWPDEEERLIWWLNHPHPVEESCLMTLGWQRLTRRAPLISLRRRHEA